MFRKVLVLTLLLSLVLSLVACGKASTSTATVTATQTATQTVTTATATTTSGIATTVVNKQTGFVVNIPFITPKNDGVLANLPADVLNTFNNAPYEVRKSAYENFAKKDPPWTIDLVQAMAGPSGFDEQTTAIEGDIAIYQKAGLIKSYTKYIANGDLNTQLQQFQTCVEKGADLILLNPSSDSAFTDLIKQAYDKGIVVVTISTAIDNPYSMAGTPNQPFFNSLEIAQMISYLKGQGHILAVEGIAGHPSNVGNRAGFHAVADNYPGVTYDVINGDWDSSVAKAQALQYFATHPGSIDGIYEQANMFQGCIEALQQAGRPLVPVTFSNPEIYAIVFAHQNQGKPGWVTMGSANSQLEDGDICFRVGIATLMGFGPKFNQFMSLPPIINDDNLADWYQSSYSLSDTMDALPPHDLFMPESLLDKMFDRPVVLPAPTLYHAVSATAPGAQ